MSIKNFLKNLKISKIILSFVVAASMTTDRTQCTSTSRWSGIPLSIRRRTRFCFSASSIYHIFTSEKTHNSSAYLFCDVCRINSLFLRIRCCKRCFTSCSGSSGTTCTLTRASCELVLLL